MTTEEVLFALLRAELWQEPFTMKLPTADFVSVMELAHQQTVTAIAINPLANGSYGDDWNVVSKYISRSLKIQRKNTSVNHELASFAQTCREEGIDYLVVKGQMAAAHYPHPMLRMSGDIDFLIREEYRLVRPRLQSALNITLPEQMIEKEVSFTHGKVLYELHNALLTFGSQRNRDYWEQLVGEAWNEHHYISVAGTDVRTLPPTLGVAYIFCHLFHHFIREGVGLRQVCDLAVELHWHRRQLDREQLKAIFEQLDMTRAFRAFGHILVARLGLPEADFPLSIGPDDRKWEQEILADIFKGGNFGKANHKTTKPWRFKLETLRLVLRNSLRYYPLAPTEIRLFALKLLKINIRLAIRP